MIIWKVVVVSSNVITDSLCWKSLCGQTTCGFRHTKTWNENKPGELEQFEVDDEMLKLGKNRVFSECAKKRAKLGSFDDSFRCWAIQYWEWMVCYWMHNLHHTAYSTIYLLSGYSWDFLINFFVFMLNDSRAQENSTGKKRRHKKKTTNWIIRSVCLTNTIYNFRKRLKTMAKRMPVK